jgi:DNA-binding CsgD family transcriptional regulator
MAVALRALRALSNVSTPEQLSRELGRVVRNFGVEHWVYAINLPLLNDRHNQFTLGDYPGDWVERYLACDYLKIDPVVAHCHDHGTPFIWSEAQLRARCAVDPHHSQVRRMFDEAEEFGLGAGISVPLHGPGACWGLMSFAAPRARSAEIERRLPELTLVAHYAHEAARPFARSKASAPPPELTRRERECLHWAAEGKTSWEVGRLLGVSERTAIFHLHNAAKKLEVSGRQAAIARAISLGLINPA